MDEINDGNLLNRLNSPSRKSPRTPTGGSTCVMLPLFQSGPNGAPFKPFQLNKNYPAIHGLLNISGLTAYSYKAHGTARDLVFFTNPSNEDAFHPTYLKAITLVDVEQESKVLLDRPSLGKVNPSDCVDMECDAKKKVLIKDLDGSFLGGVGAVIPEAEFGWDDPEEISRGLGDYRVPKTMVTATDGSRFDVSDIADHRGIIRSDDCVYNSAWQAYDCHGPNARDYAMLVVESLDEDTETRRLSPVALLGDKYMDLNNGPQDHGWCFGYTCQKRLSTFFMIVATGVHYDMFMTGYPPRNLRFHLLNVDESKTIRIALYVPRPERLDIYRDISHLLIQPQNAYYDTEGEFWGRRAPSADNPDGYKPAIDSTVNGANFMDPATRLLYVTLRGSEPIEIVTVPLVLITFQVQAVSIDDFFGKNIISNLATFLDVPLSKIRMVDIVRETQQSRRKRQIQTYEVTLEFGDEVQNDTNINTTVTLTAEQLNELTDRVLLEFQQGTIFRVVNATVIGMSTQTAATNTTDYTEDVIVHKVPSALSIQHSRTVEELTAFPEVLTVSLIDDAGDVVTTLGGQWMITVELDKTGSNADPLATLSGETTVAVSNGSAVFSDLTISHAGQGYILRFRVSQPADITIGEHTELVDVTQRVVQPVFTSGIGTLYNHGDDVLMTLQLRDSSGQLLQNIDHKGLTWHATVSLDDNAIYGSSAVTGSTTFTFDTSTGTVTTTGLKISNTRSYHKYNVLFRIHTTPEPAAYDMSLSAEPIQFHDSSTDNIHEGLAATQSVKLLIMGRPYTTTRMETFKVYMYNILTDVIIGGNNRVSDGGAYIGSLDVADTTDVNTEVTFDINARSNDDVLQAVEGLTTYINGSPNLTFDGNAIQFSESQCGLTVCVVTTTSTTSTTASTSTVSTTTTTAPSSGSESDSTWIIIGVAIGLSIVLAAGAIGLACYLKRYPRSKVAPCIGGSQASLGSKSLMDSIPTESPSGTPSSDGLYHRPRSGMTPVHV
uniref:Fibrocystin-L-like n=1 Tax=Phallusia mammillata TaxID=59560 RepID=A0A6F9DNZ2_9ASCI|nr:fibrocystin-L-like [Phallusia mammillata]